MINFLPQNEAQHVLDIEDGLIPADVQDLLINFTRANISRHLRSSTTVSSATSIEDEEERGEKEAGVGGSDDTRSTVQEVLSATFEAAVIRNKKVQSSLSGSSY